MKRKNDKIIFDKKSLPNPTKKFFDIDNLVMDFRYDSRKFCINDSNIEQTHFHNHCEIYINVSGNVAFMVENKLYDIAHGDIIITKPNEFHQCVFRGDCIHEHFCLWLGAHEPCPLLDCFLNRDYGENNLISLPADKKEYLINLCRLMEENFNKENCEIERFSILFQIITIINRHSSVTSQKQIILPVIVKSALDYISKNFDKIDKISEVADNFFVSQSTLDRQFKKYLSLSPKKYLDAKKLLYSKQLIEEGKTVTEACFESGFNDCSHFINLFKEKFNDTPFKIKNKYLKDK